MAAALDYAHAEGLVHRDVKPSNILLNRRGQPVLTDFGIVRAAEGTRLTSTGTSLGTPEYMSPEQVRGEEATAASDLYALGIVLYEMLAGKVPFTATTPPAVLYQQVHEPVPPLREKRPGAPAAVEALLNQALAKEPAERYGSGAELVAALREAAAGRAVEIPTVAEASTVALEEMTPPAETPTELLEEIASPPLGAPTEPLEEVSPPPTEVSTVAEPPSERLDETVTELGVAMAPPKDAPTTRLPAPTPAASRIRFPAWAWGVVGVALVVGVILLAGPQLWGGGGTATP